MIGANACTSCTRLLREELPTEDERGRCSSFPDGIPVEVWDGSHAHQVPLDAEEVYEAMPGWEEDFDSYLAVFEAITGSPPDGLPNPG